MSSSRDLIAVADGLLRLPRLLAIAALMALVGGGSVYWERHRPKPVAPVTYVSAVATAQCERITHVVLIRSDGTFRVLTDPTAEQIAVVNLAVPDPARKTTVYLECGVST